MKKLLFIAILALSLSACTENARVKTFGGTSTFNLPVGEKLVNVTWKDSNFWYLTRPMTARDSAVTYQFCEKSSLGVVQGTYIIVETKTK